MRDWFVYSDNGEHVGPVTPELLARGLESGKVARDARVARDRVTWQPVLTVPEVVEALDILRTAADGATFASMGGNNGGPDAPSTQRDMNDLDMTDVMVRDDELRTAIAKAKRAVSTNPATTSSVPPKPPLPARASNPAMPAYQSSPPSQPKVPSAPRVPSAPAIPAAATLVAGTPGAPPLNVPPPPPATMIHSPAPPFHTPPMQPTVPSPQQPHRPPMPSQPPQHFAPPMPGAPTAVQPSVVPTQPAVASPPPATSVAPTPSAAPAAPAETKKEDKLDPRFHILIPLGVFGVFVVLSIFLTIFALITKPWLSPEEKNAPTPAATTTAAAPAKK